MEHTKEKQYRKDGTSSRFKEWTIISSFSKLSERPEFSQTTAIKFCLRTELQLHLLTGQWIWLGGLGSIQVLRKVTIGRLTPSPYRIIDH